MPRSHKEVDSQPMGTMDSVDCLGTKASALSQDRPVAFSSTRQFFN